MPLVRVIRKPLRYPRGLQDRMMQPGETFEARSQRDARLLVAGRRVEWVTGETIVAEPVTVEAPQVFHPLDHDKDGEKGGSLPAAERGKDEIWAELEARGIEYDRRWGMKRLQSLLA